MPRATTRNEGDRIVNIGLASEEFLFALAIRRPADDRAFFGALGPNILEVAGRLIGKMPAAYWSNEARRYLLVLLTIACFRGFTTSFGVLSAGTKFVAPLSWWRAYLPSGIARMLAGLCP